jgi:hypothetical protein
MDPLTIVIGTVALAALVGLAWIGGYQLGEAIGADRERDMTKPRIEGLLNELNKYKPRVTRKRRVRK